MVHRRSRSAVRKDGPTSIRPRSSSRPLRAPWRDLGREHGVPKRPLTLPGNRTGILTPAPTPPHGNSLFISENPQPPHGSGGLFISEKSQPPSPRFGAFLKKLADFLIRWTLALGPLALLILLVMAYLYKPLLPPLPIPEDPTADIAYMQLERAIPHEYFGSRAHTFRLPGEFPLEFADLITSIKTFNDTAVRHPALRTVDTTELVKASQRLIPLMHDSQKALLNLRDNVVFIKERVGMRRVMDQTVWARERTGNLTLPDRVLVGLDVLPPNQRISYIDYWFAFWSGELQYYHEKAKYARSNATRAHVELENFLALQVDILHEIDRTKAVCKEACKKLSKMGQLDCYNDVEFSLSAHTDFAWEDIPDKIEAEMLTLALAKDAIATFFAQVDDLVQSALFNWDNFYRHRDLRTADRFDILLADFWAKTEWLREDEATPTAPTEDILDE